MNLQEVFNKIAELWFVTIFTVDKTNVTLGQIAVGICIFVIGFILIKSITKMVDKKILAKADLEISVRHTIKSFLFYFLLVFLALFTLRMLGIPLTIFTVLGGALAIGVGFGSQNIVNNFISGLIVMIEKPVRINDFIELEGLTGKVERIGARSTIVSSTDNTWHVVPNSFLLEKSLLNWTLSDDVIRASVTVGVAYGSPTRKVEEHLMAVMKNSEAILSYPEPIVLFEDFADNSLNFRLLFWIKATNPLTVRKVASELRYEIDDRFNEAGIVIAFPQRDVHLDTLRPLQIEVKKETNPN